MDHIEDINSELTTFKGEQSILLRTKEGTRVVLTNQVILLFVLFLTADVVPEWTCLLLLLLLLLLIN